MTRMSVKRVCTDAMLLASALIISYLESLLPLTLVIPVPGVKLGLANIAVMVAFFKTGKGDAAVVSFLRVAVCALLFGSVTSLWFSLAGAALAFLALLAGARLLARRCSVIGLSVLSAAMHCVGQLLAAALLLADTTILYYLWIMLAFSVPTGVINGVAAGNILRLLPDGARAEKSTV